jgi:hypothetical protein
VTFLLNIILLVKTTNAFIIEEVHYRVHKTSSHTISVTRL